MGSPPFTTSITDIWKQVHIATELLERKAVVHAEWTNKTSGRFKATVTHSKGKTEFSYELDLGPIYIRPKRCPNQEPDIAECKNFHLCPVGIRNLIAAQLMVTVTKGVKECRKHTIDNSERSPQEIQTVLRSLATNKEDGRTKLFFLMSDLCKEQMIWSFVQRLKDAGLKKDLVFYGFGVIKKTKPAPYRGKH